MVDVGILLAVAADVWQQTAGDDKRKGELVGACRLDDARSRVGGVLHGLAQAQECLGCS
jgi:hypothetical protein